MLRVICSFALSGYDKSNVPFKPLEWTEEEKALGVGNHAVKLSEKDRYRFHVLARAEEILGEEFVDAQIRLLEIATNNKEEK